MVACRVTEKFYAINVVLCRKYCVQHEQLSSDIADIQQFGEQIKYHQIATESERR